MQNAPGCWSCIWLVCTVPPRNQIVAGRRPHHGEGCVSLIPHPTLHEFLRRTWEHYIRRTPTLSFTSGSSPVSDERGRVDLSIAPLFSPCSLAILWPPRMRMPSRRGWSLHNLVTKGKSQNGRTGFPLASHQVSPVTVAIA